MSPAVTTTTKEVVPTISDSAVDDVPDTIDWSVDPDFWTVNTASTSVVVGINEKDARLFTTFTVYVNVPGAKVVERVPADNTMPASVAPELADGDLVTVME